MNDKVWHYTVRGEQKGPVDDGAIKALVDAGVVTSTTSIWREGMGDWEPAYKHISGLVPPAPGQRPVRAMGGPVQSAAEGPEALEGIGFADGFKRAFSNYATFTGRASRSEYWWFYLGALIIAIVLIMIDIGVFNAAYTGVSPLSSLFTLAILLPQLGVGCRRLHDIDRSGWWLLIAFVPFGVILLIVWFCTRGTQGPNRFGTIQIA
jgi:uncharacterized membrane protein YhaH (DUF805 family)